MGDAVGVRGVGALLLWQPAIVVRELNSQQNIIAVVVDDSRSMGIADSDGKTREAAALAALESGVLDGLQNRFQTRVYRLGSELTWVDGPEGIAPVEAATNIGDGLKQLATETADLPLGAILLLSDGSQNTPGIGGSEISRRCIAGAGESAVAGAHGGLRQGGSGARCGDRGCQRTGERERQCAYRRDGQPDTARLRGTEGEVDGARGREGAGGTRDHFSDRCTPADRGTVLSCWSRRREKPHVPCGALGRRRECG